MRLRKRCLAILAISLSALVAGQRTGLQSAEKVTEDEPRLIHAEVPLYPLDARIAHIVGTVKVRVTVRNGVVIKTEVISGHPILAKSTRTNVKSWQFSPGVNETFTTMFIYEMERQARATAHQTNPKIEMHIPALVRIIARPILLEDSIRLDGNSRKE